MINKIKILITYIYENTGYYTYSSIFLVFFSGFLLSIPYKVNDSINSIINITLNNPIDAYVRSFHYWSSQLFLIFSFLHFYRHINLNSEKNISYSKWIRLIILILVILYAMFSGFLLRNDFDSQSAMKIAKSLLSAIPILGNTFSYILLDNNEIIYLMHISISSIYIIVISIEHSKIIFPKINYFIFPLILSILLSILLIPYFNITFINENKGPYYFIGLQELLFWLNYPVILLILITFIFISLIYLHKANLYQSKIIKKAIIGLFFIHILLTITAIIFRGEFWKFEYQKIEKIFKQNFLLNKNYFRNSAENIKLANGKPESCLNCHRDVVGLNDSHNPNIIGCSSCHLGDNLSLDKELSHKGMILIPSNLNIINKTCGNFNCHENLANRVENSIMNKLYGLSSVDKFVFGEVHSLDNMIELDELKNSPADLHLKNLCVGCHIGAIKEYPDTISQLTRGGGCSACHIDYSHNAKKELLELKQLKSRNEVTKFHPDINIKVTDNACFGCHSRSGRISLNYMGLAEDNISNIKERVRLEDGRELVVKASDIHFKAGLNCIDCHFSEEIMGDGKKYFHKEEQNKIECNDCHPKSKNEIRTADFNNIDNETKLLIYLRNFGNKNKYIYGKNFTYSNLILHNDSVKLLKKIEAAIKNSKFQSEKCYLISEHNTLECKTCHTGWSPNCVGCHTNYNPNLLGFDNLSNKTTQGAWIETEGKYFNDYPTLGVSIKNNMKRINAFSPGMIINLNKSLKNENENIFHRLYSPVSPHTIQKEARDCKSCHWSSLALGYGRGLLKLKKNKIIFEPSFASSTDDNLPLDAWIPFLQERKNIQSTRNNARAFNIKEQMSILEVGVCLSCHKEDDKIYYNYKNYKNKISKKCIKPIWN